MEDISKYIEDKRFLLWVFNPSEELDEWWGQYQLDNEQERGNIREVKRILLHFRSKHKDLTEEEKLTLLREVLKNIERKEKSRIIGLFQSLLFRYAAIALLFFALGAILFYQKPNKQANDLYSSESSEEAINPTEAKLIRYTGESITLGENKSKVSYSNSGLLLVNQDTIKVAKPDAQKTREILNQLIIPFGKNSEIVLPDGTKVYLNAGTKLVYPEYFIGDKREVSLSGEAFFEVSPDQEHPFVVKTSDISIEVLGTHFNVSAYPSDEIIETVLVEGKIALQKNKSGFFDRKLEVEPNQLVSFDKLSNESVVKYVDVENYVSWKDKILKFDSADLCRVINKIERYYNIRVGYANPLLGSMLISGKIQLQEDKDEIIGRIARTASVTIIKKDENRYEIGNKK